MVIFILMKKEEVGLFVAKRRKALKVNQRDLAAICGVSEHALCNLERGIGNPTLNLVSSVLDALGLEMHLCAKNVEAP